MTVSQHQILELAKGFRTGDKPIKDSIVDFLERFRKVGQLESRTFSALLNHTDAANLYTPIIRSPYLDFALEVESKKNFVENNVISIVLGQFPILTLDTEFDQFIEFKSDPDTKLKLARLKDWILEIGKKEYSQKEIHQKIDYLLTEYTEHVHLHKLKYDLGLVETMVTVSLEVIENLAKLSLSKAAKALFDLSRKKVGLIEAELSTPGKELAFLHKANETFNK